MKTLNLNGTWKFCEKKSLKVTEGNATEGNVTDGNGTSCELYPVTVPGSVLSGLLENKLIDDPYFGENEYKTRDLFWKDYSFARHFEIADSEFLSSNEAQNDDGDSTKENSQCVSDLLKEDSIDLVAEGLDTLADIYVNGVKIAHTENMHRTWRIPVKNFLKAGDNEIRIDFASPLKYMAEHKASENKQIDYIPCGCIKGNQYLRKSHSMFGWDWGAQLPDCGIWRDIRLEAYSEIRLDDVRFVQHHEHAAEGVVGLDVNVTFDKPAESRYKLTVTVQYAYNGLKRIFATQAKTRAVLINPGDKGLNISFEIDDAKLWWPNDQGEQNLYDVDLTLKPVGVLSGGGAAATSILKMEALQTRHFTIGLRTLTVSQEPDEWGKEYALCVNGKKLFSMGADYIPEDCIYSRITRERQEHLIRSSAMAHFNTLRVWGGGYYPSEDFYDLCDKYGIVVWQDLMYACNVYDLTDDFRENIIAETVDNIRRLRHHASLGFWCGNNEMESAWAYWGWSESCSAYLKADYIKMYEEILPNIVKREDPSSMYWPSSPSSGGCFDNPGDESRGDVHYWDVWHGLKPFTDYLKHYFRYCSEFGFQSFPELKTVESFTNPEDRNIFSPVMESHQKNDSANGKMLYYLSETFRYPKNFESLLYATQILQAVAVRTGVEHWRRNRGRCMGAVYWQLNDNWPVASWSSIDYFGRWKALHYMAEDFFAPHNGNLLKTGEVNGAPGHFSGVQAWSCNESADELNVRLTLSLKKMNFEVIKQVSVEKTVAPYSSEMIFVEDYSDILSLEAKPVKQKPADNLILGKSSSADNDGKISRRNVFVEAVYEFETADGRTETMVVTDVLAPWKYMELEAPEISFEVTEDEKGYNVSLKANKYAPFAVLNLKGADALMSDNSFDISDSTPVNVRIDKNNVFAGKICNKEELYDKLMITSLQSTYFDAKGSSTRTCLHE